MPFLKEGSIPNILKKNQETILKLGIPIVDRATLQYKKFIALPPIITYQSTLLNQRLCVVSTQNMGGVFLGTSLEIGNTEAHFNWHMNDSDRNEGFAVIEPDEDVFNYKGLGLGRSIFMLGMKLIDRVGPLLPDEHVYSVIVDGSNENGPGWTSAIMKGYPEYSVRGSLHKLLDYDESGLVFIKQIK
ncbi:hypothetical protein CANDROIZ_140008 [Candidatus Roizmanbacteria bacterium]|nr:hypothetical protein CANDROIZ_140008 [Candidatus Roizmanbacteria bacterium]